MKYLDEKYNIRFNTIALELEIQLKEKMKLGLFSTSILY
jgi:hypothetical protein